MPTALVDMPTDDSGFIDSPIANGFGAEMKREFINRLEQSNGDASITSLASQMGISPSTVLRHMQIDKAFTAEIERAKRWFAFKVEGVLQSCALDPKKTLDRIAYLRAYMPERYARQELSGPPASINIIVQGEKATKIGKIVDAELVSEDNESAS